MCNYFNDFNLFLRVPVAPVPGLAGVDPAHGARAPAVHLNKVCNYIIQLQPFLMLWSWNIEYCNKCLLFCAVFWSWMPYRSVNFGFRPQLWSQEPKRAFSGSVSNAAAPRKKPPRRARAGALAARGRSGSWKSGWCKLDGCFECIT